MSHYRAPPAVLPSCRPLLSPGSRDGVLLSCEATNEDVDRAVADGREEEARDRAAAAPCPAFVVGPVLRPPFRLPVPVEGVLVRS